MRFNRATLVAAAGAAIATALLAGSVALGAPAGPPRKPAGPVDVRQADGFQYTVHAAQDRVTANVVGDLHDPATFQRYSSANTQRARALVAASRGEPVPVVLTFKQPVPVDDAKRLAADTGVAAKTWIVGQRRQDGQKTSGIFPKDIPAGLTTVTTPRGETETVLGVMVVSGTVPATPQGLGRLLADPRVYIADVSEAEMRRLLEQDSNIAGKPKEVVVESPFWRLNW